MKEELVFLERQYFKRWFVIVLSLFIFLPVPVIFYIITVLDKAAGQNTLFLVTFIVVTLLMLLMAVLLFIMRLDTIIDKEGVYYRMFPFHWRFKTILWDDIMEAEVTKFSPLRRSVTTAMRVKGVTIGGHGMHFGIGFSSYTLSGNKALLLSLTNHKKVYIGTQKAEELSEFLVKLDAKRKQK